MSKATARRTSARCMTEYDEQCALMAMVHLWERQVPELQMLFHVPNGGARDVITGARLKRAGVRRGVPDLFLPVARGEYHGLAVELKRERGGQVDLEQEWWLERLGAEGWRVAVCRGHRAAWAVLEEYLGLEMPLVFGLGVGAVR